jgi:2-keto-3-deoxy-L-rhamnonate aldolase RhmA
VERIDEIAATPGIDVLFIGTSDLAFSMGFRGRQDEPALQEAIRAIVSAAQRHGKFVGRPAATPDKIREFMDQGFLFFQTGTELGLMTAGAKQLLAPFGIEGIAIDRRALY